MKKQNYWYSQTADVTARPDLKGRYVVEVSHGGTFALGLPGSYTEGFQARLLFIPARKAKGLPERVVTHSKLIKAPIKDKAAAQRAYDLLGWVLDRYEEYRDRTGQRWEAVCAQREEDRELARQRGRRPKPLLPLVPPREDE